MSRRNEPDIASQLKERFDRWEFLYRYGGSDPFYSDGDNLNIVRNHIIYFKQQLEEQYGDGALPEIYYRPTPSAVDSSYMARSDEIRSAARQSLETYKADAHYRYIRSHAIALDPKQRESTHIRSVLGYVTSLERAISDDDLITMRRHENPERYIQSFAECEERVKKALTEPQEQTTLFSLLYTDEPDEDESFTMQ